MRDFVYIKDVVNVLYFLMHHRKDSGIYNLGTGKARTFLDLATSTFNALGKPVSITFVPTPEDILFADRVALSARPRLVLALSALVAGLACYADPYARLLYSAWFTLAMLTAWDIEGDTRTRARHAMLLVAYSLLGLIPDWLLRHSASANAGPMGLSSSVLAHNWKLLWETCGPWAFGTRPLYSPVSEYVPWALSPALVWNARLGTTLFLAGTLSGAALVFSRKIPWPVRRLGLVGAAGVYGTFAAFLCSVMVMDHFSMRYLASAFLMAPFALAPLAWLLRERMRVLLLAVCVTPYLLAAAVCGWVAFYPYF